MITPAYLSRLSPPARRQAPPTQVSRNESLSGVYFSNVRKWVAERVLPVDPSLVTSILSNLLITTLSKKPLFTQLLLLLSVLHIASKTIPKSFLAFIATVAEFEPVVITYEQILSTHCFCSFSDVIAPNKRRIFSDTP